MAGVPGAGGRSRSRVSKLSRRCFSAGQEHPCPALLFPGVVLVQYASFWRRVAATLIDSLAVDAGAYVLGAEVGAIGFSAGAAGEGVKAVAFVLGVLFGLAYSVLFTGLLGQTPGKMAVGIKVVLADGRVPGIGRAFLREVVGKFLSGLVLCVGYLWMLWDPERRCWHDRLVGTRVVRVARVVPAGPAVDVC